MSVPREWSALAAQIPTGGSEKFPVAWRGNSSRWSGSASRTFVTRTSRFSKLMPVTYGWLGAASQTAFGPLTTGMCRKSYEGGGDAIHHSSVSAFHGFGPATAPLRRLIAKLISMVRTASAISPAPALATLFSVSQCSPA